MRVSNDDDTIFILDIIRLVKGQKIWKAETLQNSWKLFYFILNLLNFFAPLQSRHNVKYSVYLHCSQRLKKSKSSTVSIV